MNRNEHPTRIEANHEAVELRLYVMNGSFFPLTGHELVAVLRSRRVVTFLSILAIVLALPSGGTVLGDLPLWARLFLNLASVMIFVGIFPALYFDAAHRAVRAGKDGVHHLLLTLPAACLTALATEALAIALIGESALTRGMLLTKITFSMLFWELLIFVLARYYAPALLPALAAEDRDGNPPDIPLTLAFGPHRIEAARLLRIETDGRLLRLHTEDRIETAPVRLRDALEQLAPHGLLVHRCHWVAHGQLGPVERVGRSYRMTTRSGAPVPVARERRQDVLDALAKGSEP